MDSQTPCSPRQWQREEADEEETEETDPKDSFLTEAYQYELPPGLIAQQPLRRRELSRLMVLKRKSGQLHHGHFRGVRGFLQDGDLVVVNNSKVLPARLVGSKKTGGKVDILLLQPVFEQSPLSSWVDVRSYQGREWNCLIRSSRRPQVGQVFFFSEGETGEVVGGSEGGVWQVRFSKGGKDFFSFLDKSGLTPLPPYIKREQIHWENEDADQDRARYQTVFAKAPGSVAAPTAGFHFSEGLCRELKETGIDFAEITLHVGQATFLPIRTEDIRKHMVWPERFGVSSETAARINKARQEGRRVVAVGTTVVRCLEAAASEQEGVTSGEGWATNYIVPGWRFKVVDAMITNFHLPRSSLLVLVSAFAGRRQVLQAYQEAVEKGYRFFSYGDCMLIQ